MSLTIDYEFSKMLNHGFFLLLFKCFGGKIDFRLTKKFRIKSSSRVRFYRIYELICQKLFSLFFFCTNGCANFKYLRCISLFPLWISEVSVDLYFVALFFSTCKMGVLGKMVQIANWDQVSEYFFDYILHYIL